MRISKKIQGLKPSATLTINAKTQELRAQGREVVSLAVGEPDFPTPKHIREATKMAVDQGHTRYTPVPGMPRLRAAIAAWYNRFYGIHPEAEHTIASNGGKQVLYNLLVALCDPGDEVLIPAPYWVSYPAMVHLADGVSVFVPTQPEQDFLVDIASLEAHATDRTRVLILNTPSNPTGCHYTQDKLEAIAAWAKDKGIFVISDEVYDRLVYPPAEPSSLTAFWQENMEHVAIVGALSKSLCMTGFRMGYALAHPDLVKAMTRIQGQSTSNVNSIAQVAAIAALEGDWDIVENMNQAFQQRRDLALEIITSWPGVSCPTPGGAFYLFPTMEALYDDRAPDSTALCERMLEEAGVATVPGIAFGDDRCVRFSYAVADDVLEKALTKVGKALTG